VRSKAFSPGHITGLFSICMENEILKTGSIGAGVNISEGVFSNVCIKSNNKSDIQIKINNIERTDAYTSKYVIEKALRNSSKTYSIKVNHHTDLPIGSGFGTSGAGALSLSLALNEILELGMTRIEAAQLAHEAEVSVRTGLGTVSAELEGGIDLRTVAGAPGIGETNKIPLTTDLTCIALVYGPMPTSEMLNNEVLRERINVIGQPLLDRLIENPNVETFLKCSSEFTKNIGLMTPRVNRALNKLEELGYNSGMIMFGEGIFTLTEKKEVSKIIKHLEPIQNEVKIIVSKVDNNGAHSN